MAVKVKQIAQIFLFDRNHRLIIYLRDDKPGIPFPNHRDLIGGRLEAARRRKRRWCAKYGRRLALSFNIGNFFAATNV